MGSVALLFVVFLYVVPSFWSNAHPVPPLQFFGILAVLAVIAVALWAWRLNLKNRRKLNRREGLVSGQMDSESLRPRS